MEGKCQLKTKEQPFMVPLLIAICCSHTSSFRKGLGATVLS